MFKLRSTSLTTCLLKPVRQTHVLVLTVSLCFSFLVSHQAHAIELLVDQQTGIVTVLGNAQIMSDLAVSKPPYNEGQDAQTREWLLRSDMAQQMHEGALLAIVFKRDGTVSSAMRLAGTRARLMDRPMQKVDARGVGSQVLYAIPDYLQKQGAQVQLWKKESSGRFSLMASL